MRYTHNNKHTHYHLPYFVGMENNNVIDNSNTRIMVF